MRQSMFRNVFAVVVTLGSTLVAAKSQAAVMTTVYTAPTVTVDPSAAGVNRTFSVTANQFNGSLGTLNSIEVTLSVTETISAIATGSGGGFNWSGGGTVAFNGSPYAGFGLSGTATGNANQAISGTDTEGNDTVLIGDVNTSPATITGAIGSGSYPITFGYAGSYAGNAISGPQYTSSETVTVAYNYTSVPEPVGLSLLALGGIGVLGRRFRKA